MADNEYVCSASKQLKANGPGVLQTDVNDTVVSVYPDLLNLLAEECWENIDGIPLRPGNGVAEEDIVHARIRRSAERPSIRPRFQGNEKLIPMLREDLLDGCVT